MTEEINQQVDSLLEGTLSVPVAEKPKRKSRAKPFSLNDCTFITDVFDCWGKMVKNKTVPEELVPPDQSAIDVFAKAHKYALAYCALYPINIADLKVSSFFDLGTLKAKPVEDFDTVLNRLAAKTVSLDTCLAKAKEHVKEETVAAFFSTDYASRIAALKNSLSSKHATLASLQDDYATVFSEVKKMQAELVFNETESKNPVTCPPEFYTNEFFQLAKVDGDYCYFVTKDVVLVDPRPNGCSPVNLGKFLVKINPKNFSTNSVAIRPFFNNIDAGGYYHPHVSNGRICWGNAFEPAAKGFHERNFKQFFKVLFSLLSTYNYESPYKEMGRFVSEQSDRYLTPAGFKSWLNATYYRGVTAYISSCIVFYSDRTTTLERVITGAGVNLSPSASDDMMLMNKMKVLETKVVPLGVELAIPDSLFELDEASVSAKFKGTSFSIPLFFKGDSLVLIDGKLIHRQSKPEGSYEEVPVQNERLALGNTTVRKAIEEVNADKFVTIDSLLRSATEEALKEVQNETTTN